MTPRRSRLLVIVLGVLIGGLTGYRWELGLTTALGLAALVVAFYRPYLLAIALFGWTAFRSPLLDAVPGLFWVMNVGETAILGLVLMAALMKGISGHWIFDRRWPWIAAALFVFSAGVSAALNGSSLLQLSMGLRGHFVVPLLGLAAAVLVDGEPARRAAVRLATLIVAVQVPVGIAQFVLSGVGPKGPDIVYGTLGAGGSNNLGFVMLGAMVIFAGEYVKTRRVPFALGVLACAPVFVFTSARFGLLLSPVVMFSALVFAQPERGRGLGLSRRAVLALAVVVSAAALIGIYYEYRPLTAYRDLSPAYFASEQGPYIQQGVSRVGYLVYGGEFLERYAAVPALGTGPASASSGAAANIEGSLAYEFARGLQLFGHSEGLDPTDPYHVPMPHQLAADLVEYGAIGTALFMAFAVGIGMAIWRRLKVVHYPHLTRSGFGLWFGLYTLGTIYTVSWEGMSAIAVGFWWWVIVLTSGRGRATT